MSQFYRIAILLHCLTSFATRNVFFSSKVVLNHTRSVCHLSPPFNTYLPYTRAQYIVQWSTSQLYVYRSQVHPLHCHSLYILLSDAVFTNARTTAAAPGSKIAYQDGPKRKHACRRCRQRLCSATSLRLHRLEPSFTHTQLYRSCSTNCRASPGVPRAPTNIWGHS